MMRLLAGLMTVALLLASCGSSDHSRALVAESGPLTIYSTTDRAVFDPVIADFRAVYPNVEIRYVDLDAAELDRRFRAESAKGRSPADLLLSAAMDLQVRLVNEGYAAPHTSLNSAQLPGWARWRDEAIGFTFEPVVMVFNRRVMAGRKIPRTRPELLAAVRADPQFWKGRIGTYDARRSSVGYLVASQDARQSSDFGAIAEAFRDAGLVTADTSGEVLDRIEDGELALGYNVLGSYARARVENSRLLQIVYPADYTLAVARTAVIPRTAANSRAAHLFLDYLISIRGQQALTNQSTLSAVRPEISGRYSRMGIAESSVGQLRPIPLGPGLLVYLDQQKRERLLALWSGEPR
jgi:iron(III) transport system substrate-binding protein